MQQIRLIASPKRLFRMAVGLAGTKMMLAHFFTCLVLLLSLTDGNGFCQSTASEKTNIPIQKKVLFIDFTDYSEGPIESWLNNKGFLFQRDASNRRKLDLDVADDGLIVEAKRPVYGLLLNEGVDLDKFTSIKIEWGVNQYPEGASYEKGIRNEALMVVVFFGYDRLSSGHFLIPNAPYFIGLFLGEEEHVGRGYVGRYFKKNGRFVCLGNPKPGERITTEYDLVSAFKRKYKKDEVPIISGLALAIDTTSSGGGGKASAFIKCIEFWE